MSSAIRDFIFGSKVLLKLLVLCLLDKKYRLFLASFLLGFFAFSSAGFMYGLGFLKLVWLETSFGNNFYIIGLSLCVIAWLLFHFCAVYGYTLCKENYYQPLLVKKYLAKQKEVEKKEKVVLVDRMLDPYRIMEIKILNERRQQHVGVV